MEKSTKHTRKRTNLMDLLIKSIDNYNKKTIGSNTFLAKQNNTK